MVKTKGRGTKSLLLAAMAVLFAIIFQTAISQAAVGINSQVSFQGKLVNTNGTNVPDGTYNLQFKIYQDGTNAGVGSTLKWTESRLVINTQGVTVTAGTFQVNLGSVNALTGIDWNQDTLWLSMNVGGTNSTASPTYDGEMTPFIRLTAVPYALNAGTVGGLTTSQLVQLTPGSQQSGTINVSGNIQSGASLKVGTIDAAVSGTLTVGSTNTTAISLAKNTTVGGILTVQGPVNTSTLPAAASLILDNAATSSQNVIALNVAGTNRSTIRTDSLGNLVISPTGGGALYLNNDGGSGGVYIGTTTNPNNINAYGYLQLNPGTTVPTTDQLIVDNTSTTGVTTAGLNGISVKYKGGAAAVESAGMRIDYAPGTTSGGTWSGMRIVAGATGPVSGVTSYGIKIEGSTSAGAGAEEGVYIGSGWDVGLNVQSGGIQLAAMATNPPVPTAGLRVYAKSVAGRMVLKTLGPAGIDTPLQNALWANNTVLWAPGGTTAVGNWQGSQGTNTGTATNVSPTTPNYFTMERRNTFASVVTTANQQVGIRSENMFYAGNTAGSGGFFAVFHFGLGTWTAGDRLFVGFSAGNTAIVTGNPSGLTNIVGFGIDAGDTAITLMHNDGTLTATKDAIPGQPALASNQGYDAYFFVKPNDTTVYFRLDDTNASATIIDTSTNTNVPAVNTMMTAAVLMSNGANTVAGSATIGINRLYVETDH